MLLEQEVARSIPSCHAHSLGVIGEIYHTVLDPLKVSSPTILLIKNPILPLRPGLPTQSPRAFPSLKLVPVMGIVDKELHVFGNMDVNNDRSVVLGVKL